MSDIPPDLGLARVPDFLGKAARVDAVGRLLQSAQEQIQALETTRTFYCHDDAHEIVAEGTTTTYAARIKTLNDGIAALMQANDDIYDELVAHGIEVRKQVELTIQERLRQPLPS